MSKVTEEIIDNTYDALTMMRLFSQRLSEGEVNDNLASEMSWLLGSAKKRLEPVLELLEEIQNKQSRAPNASDYVIGLVKNAVTDADDDLDILSEISAVTAKFHRRRQNLEGKRT